MINIDSYDVLILAQKVDKICNFFLHPRKISYFQFKRIYENGTSITLANHPEFFKEFLKDGFIEPKIHLPVDTRQSSFCFWDEILSEAQLLFLKEKQGVYHGLTILSRRKTFYDCATFAMSEPHLTPVAYYLYILKDLQNFLQIFPTRARYLIKELSKNPSKAQKHGHRVNRKYLFLPKRSSRFYIGDDVNNYITTYEALCVQLVQEGRSYKEIGSILSMATSTVKTHLIRLKARTGLSFQEICLQSFQTYKNSKDIVHLESGHKKSMVKETKKHKKE